ncbi:hypothetical protein TNCV_1377801 [Trichonephila clavipes]|nr:hypothetical protein TNCV_1377801 [Trichonephila clavipes]
MAGQYIKLYTDTFEQHDALNALLDNVKFPHYTITPKTQRLIKVVIKGLPHDTKSSDISNDLIDLGFSVDRVTQLKGNISKQLLPIFLITLPRNLTNAKIFDLKTLSYLSQSQWTDSTVKELRNVLNVIYSTIRQKTATSLLDA